ncbi:MAG TPA: glycosyltransferase family 9 protein, partial [Chitinophagaceae bacterium]
MKFLLIRFSPVGDIVLASPLIRSLRKQFPEATIHFLTDDSCRSAVEFNPSIDKLHVLAHSPELMIEELKSEEYDHIIDLQANDKSALVARSLHKKPFSVRRHSFRKKLLTSFKINLLPREHVVEQYFKAVESLDVKIDTVGLEYFIADSEETKKNDIPASHYAGYIACAIGAEYNTKKWPLHKWKEFCAQLDHPIILLGSREDAAAGKEIASADDIKIYNACGKFSLNEMADLTRKAKLVVCNENDSMQIAAAYKRPIVSIWGNT